MYLQDGVKRSANVALEAETKDGIHENVVARSKIYGKFACNGNIECVQFGNQVLQHQLDSERAPRKDGGNSAAKKKKRKHSHLTVVRT